MDTRGEQGGGIVVEDAVSAPDVAELVRMFEEAEEGTQDARRKAERDIDYRDGKQWTADEEAKLRERGQPVVTFNRIQRKVNYLKGLEAQTRKNPKAFPRTPGDDGAAQAATDALRYVCDDQDWDSKRSEAFDDILTPGTGAIMVGAQRTRNGIDPALVHIPWDRFFHDPHSRRFDFSDAAYMGIVTWMDCAKAKRLFPGYEDVIESTWASARNSDTYDDRPKFSLWADHRRRRVRIVEIYFEHEDEWWSAFFTKAGYLSEPGPSPYLDADGRPECPIKAVSAFVDRDNNRFGEVRMMISPQDEVNKRRSKLLHRNNSNRLRISRAASVPGGEDASAIKREMAKPDGIIFAESGEVELIGDSGATAVEFQLLQESKAEIDLLGPNAALAGKNENDASGRAILAQQQGGMIEVALLMDRLRHLSLMVYRSIWARIRQYWDAPRWIRVTDDERNMRWIGLNAPRTMLDVARERLQGDPDAEFKLALLARDPRAQMVVEVQNHVAGIDIDIVIDEGMDTPTVQAEQFDTLSKMMPAMTQLPPEALELLVTASSLRDKDKMLAIIAKMKQGPSPEQQAAAELHFRKGVADIENVQSQTLRNVADAAAKRAGIVSDMAAAQQQPAAVFAA